MMFKQMSVVILISTEVFLFNYGKTSVGDVIIILQVLGIYDNEN